MKADEMHPANAKKFIRSCLESGEFIIIPHAKDAMEWESSEWRYQVKTQKMVPVVSLYERPNQVRVVTVWLMRRR
jgi:hypothetical protein